MNLHNKFNFTIKILLSNYNIQNIFTFIKISIIVQIMNVLNECTEKDLGILRKIAKKSNMSQRIMAEELGFSLGKLNYCLKQLKRKGLIKINNFRINKKKINYIYILTPKGIASKTILTLNFMKKKIEEYNQLKSEIKNQTKKRLDYKLL